MIKTTTYIKICLYYGRIAGFRIFFAFSTLKEDKHCISFLKNKIKQSYFIIHSKKYVDSLRVLGKMKK